MKKEKVFSWILSVSFLVLIMLPHVIWLFVGEHLAGENVENRNLAQRPEFSFGSIEVYPGAFEEYYNDHLPFRNSLISLYNSMMYRGFRTSINENVILGKEDWLFYAAENDGDPLKCYTGEMLLSQERLKDIADNLMYAKEQLAKMGAEFVLFIAPNKERVYSEYMPAYLGLPVENCMVNQVISYLKEHTDIRIVYAYDALMAHKRAYPEQRLYYKTDTHWNNYGSYIGARELLEELGISLPPLEQMNTSVVCGGTGDLAQMLHLPGEREKEYWVSVSGGDFGSAEQVRNEKEGNIQQYRMEGIPERKLFVRRDSFYINMMPYMNPSFSDNLLVHSSEYNSQMVLEFEPDVFVLETVERYVPYLGTPLF